MNSKEDIALSIYQSKVFSGIFGLSDLKRRIGILKFRLLRKMDRKNIDFSTPLISVQKFKDNLDAYIIIPVYGKSDHLVDCLESLSKSVGINPHVLIIDNGIPESVAEAVRDHAIVDQYITNDDNVGFGEACNQGLREIKEEFAFILNSDVLVYPDSLRKLLNALEVNPGAGICSSVLVNSQGRYEEMGRVLNADGDALPINGTRKFDPEHHQGVFTVPHVSYACIAIRKRAFDSTNGFDPIFWPAYSEDVDVSIQMFQQQYALLVELSSIVIHLQGASSSQLNKLDEIKTKNTKALLKKHKSYFANIEDTSDYLRYEYKLNRAWSANRNSSIVITNNPDIDESSLAELLKIQPEELILHFIACICLDSKTLKPRDFSVSVVNFFQNQSIKYFLPSKDDFDNWIRPLISCFDEIVCDFRGFENLVTDELEILKLTQPGSKIRSESLS